MDGFEAFRARAEAAGSEVVRFGTWAEALAFILRFLGEEGVAEAPGARAVWAEGPFLDGVDTRDLEAKVPGLTFRVTRQLAKDARIGITQMDWGIADTGTLVQDSSPAAQRLASALPGIHIAVVGTGRILPDLPALMARMDPRAHAYLAFITGPSRTADIERVLAIGVHGPERLVIVGVDEPGRERT